MMKISVAISEERCGYSYAVQFKISSAYEVAFKPLSRSDDPMIAGIMGDATIEQVETFLKLREGVAEEISEAITKALMKEMKKHDTLNGYTVIQDG